LHQGNRARLLHLQAGFSTAGEEEMQNKSSPAAATNEAPPAANPWMRAASRLDGLTWLALVCIVAGWFFLDTLVVTVGPWRRAVHFYELAAIIANPMRLFLNIDRAQLPGIIAFTLLCLGVLCTPLAPSLSRVRETWLAYVTPLALMLICGAWLYARTSGDFLNTSADTGTLTSDVVRFANDLLHRATQPVARRVSIGAGSYVAIIGCLFLAYHGVRRYRERPQMN
jgi:hypothetical protein